MTKTYKVAGQAAPVANTDVTLYTVPVGKSFVASSLIIANRNLSGTTASLKVAIVPNGETLSEKHYIEYGKLLESRGSVKLTLGLSLASGDRIIIRADTGETSFSLFGVELS